MILGCGRSGTSIFGELFEGLSRYGYESEPPFRGVLERSSDHAWAVKVPHESEEFPPDAGLSFPLAMLLDAYPSITLFWIVDQREHLNGNLRSEFHRRSIRAG